MTTTAQDTFDALSCVLTEAEVVDLIVNHAMALLEYDDDHPDVGFGMMIFQAIDRAVIYTIDEAARWKRRVFIGESIKDQATKIVKQKRARR